MLLGGVLVRKDGCSSLCKALPAPRDLVHRRGCGRAPWWVSPGCPHPQAGGSEDPVGTQVCCSVVMGM